jgi:predicted nucleic acid-binding protein
MATGNRQIIYWDTCIFLAWLKDERRKPGEMEGVKAVADLILRDRAILVTSTLTRAEILEGKVPKGAIAKYDSLMRRTNIVPQNLDVPIATVASKLRDHYRKTDFELLTPDAIHLATAMYLKAEEFHTFDGSDPKKSPRQKKYKRCGLLLISGEDAVGKMRICKPDAQQFELHLGPPTTKAPRIMSAVQFPEGRKFRDEE